MHARHGARRAERRKTGVKFASARAELFIPDGRPEAEALARTTHMGVGAHQDDLEIMAFHGILQCFNSDNEWFLGVVVSDGAGSPRDGDYASVTDAQMQEIRKKEQKKAAVVGNYGGSVVLGHPTAEVKNPAFGGVAADIGSLLAAAKPRIVYTHNPADKHDTHVGVALRTIQAIRRLPAADRPEKLYGCEVWRDLDWMLDSDKVALDVSARESLAMALLGVHDSQVAGGKRYDLASQGRRRANATYFAAHGVDKATGLIYAMDLTPLIRDDKADIGAHVRAHLERFSSDVNERLARLQ